MLYSANDCASILFHDFGRIAFKGRTKSVVGGNEEPGGSAALHDSAAGSVRKRPRIVGPMDRVRRALCARQVRCCRAGVDENLVLLSYEFVHRERDA